MKTCPNCHIRVGGAPDYCPLCQSQLLGEPEPPLWPHTSPQVKLSLVFRVLAFVLLAGAVICLGIEFWATGGVSWSVVVALCVAAFLITLRAAMRTYQSVPRLLFQLLVAVSAVVMLCDWYTGWRGFSLRWVVPVLCTVTLVTNFILSFVRRAFAENGLVYLLMNILLGVLPYLALYLSGRELSLAWMICLLVSVITFLGLVLFQGRRLWPELYKRLHL